MIAKYVGSGVRSRRRRERGMTLVEILVAMGILAGVLVSVASLFVLGGQRVNSGRHMTEATAIVSDIVEEIQQLNTQVGTIFPTCTTNTGCTVATNTDSFASAQWQSSIDQALYLGHADITLTPLGGAVSPPTFDSSEGIRVRVAVQWNEGTNVRTLAAETVLF